MLQRQARSIRTRFPDRFTNLPIAIWMSVEPGTHRHLTFISRICLLIPFPEIHNVST